jgi:hypothetical protein
VYTKNAPLDELLEDLKLAPLPDAPPLEFGDDG